jgi:hypothetical protein
MVMGLVDFAFVIGLTVLAIKGHWYRGVYLVLIPIGVIWFFLFGLAANMGPNLEDPFARHVGTEIAMLGLSAAVGGLFGGILFHKRQSDNLSQVESHPETRKCPDCAEIIRAEAKKCRFCGREFSSDHPAAIVPYS